MNKAILWTAAILASVVFGAAQPPPVAFPTTTLARPLLGWPSQVQPNTLVTITNQALVQALRNQVDASLGNPASNNDSQVILMIGWEALCVTGSIRPDGQIPVERACRGTQVYPHSVGATVWVGPARYYAQHIPYGACSTFSLEVLPTVYIDTASVWNCISGFWVFVGQT